MKKITPATFKPTADYTFLLLDTRVFLRRIDRKGYIESFWIEKRDKSSRTDISWTSAGHNLEELCDGPVVYQLTQKEAIKILRDGGWKNADKIIKEKGI